MFDLVRLKVVGDRGNERGSITLLTALCLPMLLGALAIAIDIGYLYITQRQLQTLADAAAMAGALA